MTDDYTLFEISSLANATNSTNSTIKKIEIAIQQVSPWDVISYLIVVAFAAVGGILVSFLAGYHFHGLLCIPHFQIKPLITKVKFPPLLGMLIFGCLIRNILGFESRHYHETWAAKIRGICLTLILVRGGMVVNFKGKGLHVFLLTVIPNTVEAFLGMLVGYTLFNMPFYVAYSLGYTLSCISPSVVVPCLVNLIDRGYGKDKGIP